MAMQTILRHSVAREAITERYCYKWSHVYLAQVIAWAIFGCKLIVSEFEFTERRLWCDDS